MKKVVYSALALIIIVFVGCSKNKSDKNKVKKNTSTSEFSKYPNSKLIIYYFHATNRCPTCNSIENNVKEVLEKSYKNQLENNQIIFKSLNFEEKHNEELVKKYQIAMSSLIIISGNSENEDVSDLTNIAFTYSRSEPDVFKTIISDTIKNLIK